MEHKYEFSYTTGNHIMKFETILSADETLARKLFSDNHKNDNALIWFVRVKS